MDTDIYLWQWFNGGGSAGWAIVDSGPYKILSSILLLSRYSNLAFKEVMKKFTNFVVSIYLSGNFLITLLIVFVTC